MCVEGWAVLRAGFCVEGWAVLKNVLRAGQCVLKAGLC